MVGERLPGLLDATGSNISFCVDVNVGLLGEGLVRGLTFIDFLARLVDDGAVFETSKIEHPDTAVCAAGNEDVHAVGAEADIKDFLVVGDELGFGGEGGDVPYCTCGVDAGGDDEARRKCVPVE